MKLPTAAWLCAITLIATTIASAKDAVAPAAASNAAILSNVAPSMKVEPRLLGKNEKQLVFVMRHTELVGPAKGLCLILPGGDGTADFVPFCANVLARTTFPEDWLCVELVAPQWRPPANDSIIWPSKIFQDPKAKFTTEEFIGAAIKETMGRDVVKDAPVVALGWSSSGHAVFSALMKYPELRGAIVNGVRCQESWFRPRPAIKGKAVFFYHSPEDAVCPIVDAEQGAQFLPKAGGFAKLVKYSGGHGWPPGSDHAAALREGLAWILESTSTATAKK